MHFRNLKLYKKASSKTNYYTSNTSYIQCSKNAPNTASALASLSIGAAAGTFVLKNVQNKCALELEEQQKQQTFNDTDLLKEDLNLNFNKNEDFSENVSSNKSTSTLGRKRRTRFKTSFTSRNRRGSFDGFSSNVLKVDKNIKINGASPCYNFNMDIFSTTNKKYFGKEKNHDQSSDNHQTKKQFNQDNKVNYDCNSSNIKYASAVQLIKDAQQENHFFKEEEDASKSVKEQSNEALTGNMKSLNLFSVRRSSIIATSQQDFEMKKSDSLQTQFSFKLNHQEPPTNLGARFSKKKALQTTNDGNINNEVEKQIKLIESLKLDDWLKDKDIVVSDELYESTKMIWPAEPDTGFNLLKFTETLTLQIDAAFLNQDYNKIYSLYLAMKRNDCVPSVETFDKIIKSLCLRDMDNTNLDERMFNILTCYQDLISLKIKPLASTYHDIILSLFEGSLEAAKLNNTNGKDFYKIALDFFKTTYPSVLKHNLSHNLIEALLLSSLQYQTNLNSQFIYSILPELMMNYAPINAKEFHYLLIKFSFDFQSLQQSVFACINPQTKMVDINVSDAEESVLLITAVTTGLLRLGNLPMASQILNSTMSFFKINEENLANSSTLKQNLLEAYLLQLSQVDLKKAEQLRLVFEGKAKVQNAFIPTLSLNFYKTYLHNTMCWLPQQAQLPISLISISKSIFKRLFTMSIEGDVDAGKNLSQENRWNMIVAVFNNISRTTLSYEKLLNQVFNYFFHQQEQDLEIITMILEDSVMKNYKFSGEQYFKIFEFLINDINASDEYILRFINSHGLQNLSDLQFLNTTVSALENNNKNDMIIKLSKTKYFVKLTSKFDLSRMNDFEFKGLTRVFQSIWSTKQDISMIAVDLGTHSFILNEVFNVEYLCNKVKQQPEVTEFFRLLEVNFRERYLNFTKLKLDEHKLDPQVELLATKVLGL